MTIGQAPERAFAQPSERARSPILNPSIDMETGGPLVDPDMRFLVAIRAFLAVLLGRPLPEGALPRDLLEAKARNEARSLGAGPAPSAALAGTKTDARSAAHEGSTSKAEPQAGEASRKEAKPDPTSETRRPTLEAAAVRALSIFQSEGRLLDFLSEEIDGYSDQEIGAAVREIHRGCRRALHDHFKLAPVRTEDEESMVTVPEGYDPAEIRLVGNVVGRPPFSGTLKHKGWRVEEVRLPHIPEGPSAAVVVPAEVEV